MDTVLEETFSDMLLTTDKSIQLMYYFIVVCKVFNRQIFKWRTKSGIWYSLWFTLLLSGGFQCGVNGLTEFRGQVIEDVRTIKFSQSPFFVTGNVAVERGGELRIEPGVELRFLAGTGLLVRGTLVAEVSVLSSVCLKFLNIAPPLSSHPLRLLLLLV